METIVNENATLNLKAVSARTGDLPPIPAIAMKALQITKDPNVSARQVQAAIAHDQALSARILRIVNSAMYGLSREVSTISHAVAILGMETLRSILMAAAVQQVLHTGGRGTDLTGKLLSDHSWGTALAARIIAKRTRYESDDEAFLCGLMHDIGKPVLQKNFPDQYLNVISEAYRSGTEFHLTEMQLFGFSHAQVGALLCEKWNFPAQLASSIGFHHDPLAASAHAKLACIVNLADLTMVRLEVGIRKNKDMDLMSLDSTRYLKLDETAVTELLDEIRPALAKAPELF